MYEGIKRGGGNFLGIERGFKQKDIGPIYSETRGIL